jgi:hypothetical protein
MGRALLAVGAALVVVCVGEAAEAYPQWQLSSGATRCNQCHYAPGGGGLITSYGRDAAGEQLSTVETNGAFLHGVVQLPSWLALGGDFRGAYVNNDVQDPSGPTSALFPMQADLRGRVALPAGFSFAASGGLRGQIRDPSTMVPIQNYQPISTSQLISREHYLMWQPQAVGGYLRAGRFYAPFGLRLSEHILNINRDLGFDELQETYNVSGGFVLPAWEVHLTAFAPDFVRHIGSQEKGFAAYFERRVLDDRLAVGGQSRLAFGPGMSRFILGAVAKAYFEPLRTLLLAEVDSVQLMFDDTSVDSRSQIVGAGGIAVLPARGLVVTLIGERSQLDLQVRDDYWGAGTALINWFPLAHLELQVMGRLQFPSGGDIAKTLFAQLHYYL